MAELTATVAEARAHFSKIATSVSETGTPVTVFKNSKPWVVIAPINKDHIPAVDWSKGAVPIDARYGHAVLPTEWDDDKEDDGLYDDLVH